MAFFLSAHVCPSPSSAQDSVLFSDISLSLYSFLHTTFPTGCQSLLKFSNEYILFFSSQRQSSFWQEVSVSFWCGQSFLTLFLAFKKRSAGVRTLTLGWKQGLNQQANWRTEESIFFILPPPFASTFPVTSVEFLLPSAGYFMETLSPYWCRRLGTLLTRSFCFSPHVHTSSSRRLCNGHIVWMSLPVRTLTHLSLFMPVFSDSWRSFHVCF